MIPQQSIGCKEGVNEKDGISPALVCYDFVLPRC